MIRSFLFVPADSERKMQKAFVSGADALIFDLEDSVAADARADARQLARENINENVWVRINPLDTEDADLDLDAVMPAGPAGIVLPKPENAGDAIDLAFRLDELERSHKLDAGRTRILPLCTERPAALFSLGGYAGATERLAGLSWGAEDLSTTLGATANRDDNGNWLPPYELARSLCLVAAAAADVPAIDTVFTDFRDSDGLRRYASNARRDGFSGMLAIHPAQIGVINDAFCPSAAEIERAQRIIELFENNPGAGTLGLDGEMIDRPHLLQARRVVELAAALKTKQQG
ncbi:MAG: CoA ester lyase [Woeseiaceae bacterium]|nr:CoA ester lyase [Woeseiaceae bacterium]